MVIAALSSDDVQEPVVLRLGITGFEIVVETFTRAFVSLIDTFMQPNGLFLELFLLDTHKFTFFSFLQDLENINSLLMRQLLNERYIHFRRWYRLVRLDDILLWILQLIEDAWLVIFRDGRACGGICPSRIGCRSELIYVDRLLNHLLCVVAVQSLDRTVSLQVLVAQVGLNRNS